MAKAAYHHGDLRMALLTACERMLESQGPDALSLRGLAREAGVSPTAPYRHFTDKAALLTAVATRGFEDFKSDLVAAVDEAGADPFNALRALARAYVRFALARRGVFELMFLSDLLRTNTDEALKIAALGSFDVLADVVERCHGPGGPPRPPAAVSAWAHMHGLAMLLVHDVIYPGMTGGMDEDQVVEAITRVVPFHVS